MLGKSIRLFLADAEISGIRYAELVNWTGQAIACPRDRLGELKNWHEAKKPGVYFLFTNRFGEDELISYIGESEDVASRLISHDRNKDWWEDVVIFTSKDQNLTKAHIKFLESNLVARARDAGRYRLENGNTPTEANLPRADRDAMFEFINCIKMIIGTLGYSILEPILKSDSCLGRSNSSVASVVDIVSHESLMFEAGGRRASGVQTSDGFVLKKGSQVARVLVASCPTGVKTLHERLLAEGALEDDGVHLRVNKDILLSASSPAACLVSGNSASGPRSWRNAQGRRLVDLESDALVVNPQSGEMNVEVDESALEVNPD